MSALHQAADAPAAGPLREAAGLVVAALATRGELAALELSDARERAGQWLALALAAATLLLAALLVGALFVVSVFWESHRSEAIAVIALAYGGAGAALMAWLLARLRAAPPVLQATLAELKRDCAALRGRATP